MVNIQIGHREVGQFLTDNAGRFHRIRDRMVSLDGTEDSIRVLEWCGENQENIVGYLTDARVDLMRKGDTDVSCASESYIIFVFETAATALQFRLAFSEHVFDCLKGPKEEK